MRKASSASWLRSAARFCAVCALGAGSDRNRRPPPWPRDWVLGPPDFVGVGVQRAGTTWWYRLLCDHPSIQRTRGKEAHFFDGYFGREFSDLDAEAYHRLFPRPRGSLIGEWSPRYLHDFWTPALLRRAAPEAKILVLLRDPLQRYQSGLRHELAAVDRAVRRGRRPYFGAMSANESLSSQPLQPSARDVAGAVRPRPGPGAPIRALRSGSGRRAAPNV